MKNDANGLSVTTNSDQVICDIDCFVHELISSGKYGGVILDAAQVHPDNLLIQCYAAALNLYAQETKYSLIAKDYLLRAETLLKNSNQREKLFYQAITAWHDLNYELAITLFTTIIQQWPRDLAAIKLVEWMFYCTGQAFQAKRFLQVCDDASVHNNHNSHFLAIKAFAQELSGDLEQAFATAIRAIEIEPNTPWAHHALSHVYLMRSEIEEGISAFELFKPSWDSALPQIKSHNTWHLGLFYLANLDEENTRRLYSDGIWGVYPENSLQQLNAISYLWRMDMAGISWDEKWTSLAEYFAKLPFEHYMPFNNAHYVYALVKSNNVEAADEAVATLEKYSVGLNGENYRIWHRVGYPLVKGCLAFAKQDYQEANLHLKNIIEDVFCIGGSDAQDELFLQTYLLTLINTKQYSEADAFFDKYLKYYQPTALGDYWRS